MIASCVIRSMSRSTSGTILPISSWDSALDSPCPRLGTAAGGGMTGDGVTGGAGDTTIRGIATRGIAILGIMAGATIRGTGVLGDMTLGTMIRGVTTRGIMTLGTVRLTVIVMTTGTRDRAFHLTAGAIMASAATRSLAEVPRAGAEVAATIALA